MDQKPKKQIITIAGRPGSGKSTTAKGAAARLDFRHFSSGDLFRELARERGIDVLQANLTAEANAELDELVDSKLRDMGVKDDRLVIDSRMAWHWMPSSFKVFLDLDLNIAAERILKEMTDERLNSENIDRDPAKYALILQQRLDSESRRYKALYNADPYNKVNHDLVIDTAVNDIDKVIELVVSGFQNWLKA